MNIWDMLERAVLLHPAQTAVIDADQTLTHAEVGDRTRRLAGFLKAQGIGPGDRISILDHNSLAYLETYYAAAGLGAVLNPLNVRLTGKDLAFILRDAGTRWLVARNRFAPLVTSLLEEETPLEGILWLNPGASPGHGLKTASYGEALERESRFQPEPVQDHSAAHLYYTSGTTGTPKGVVLTHRNVCVHALAAVAELNLTDADIWGHFAPMFHLADAWATFAVTWVGGCHVMTPRFTAAAALEAIDRHRITLSNLIPTMLNLMIKHPDAGRFDVSSLRLILSGGAPIAPEVVRRVVETFGCEYIQTYGMTETSPYLTMSILKAHMGHLDEETRLRYRAKTGRPFLTVQLKVVDAAGRPVKADEKQVGEILVRGDTVTPGYWRRPEENRTAFEDGWLKTGDMAVVDAEGYITIVDRKKDVILSGGETIYSIEVENAIYLHPAVLEAAVFAVPDDTWGEAVRAAVVLKPDALVTRESLIDFLKEHLAAYKVPKGVDFLDALPRTGSGKIFKKALRDLYS